MIVNYTSKLVATIIAFALQSRVSAIQSAAMGGQIFARSLLQLGRERGLVNVSADETYMDEVVGWSVAVIGTYCLHKLNRYLERERADTISSYCCLRRLPEFPPRPSDGLSWHAVLSTCHLVSSC